MAVIKTSIEATEHLRRLVTESSSPLLSEMDTLDTPERLQLMNADDALVAAAVHYEIPNIVSAVQGIVRSFRVGGRLIYIGAGTSGRLGVLDAAECPPTFGVDPGLVVAIIAGGPSAMFTAVEGAEDDPNQGAEDIVDASVNENDTVVGISASGQAPYVIGALRKAVSLGAFTVALTNNRSSKLEEIAAVTIAPIVGPEFIAGSTRLKSGTSQKLALNMLSTNAMIEIGKTYGNLMVDVKATNSKLKARALRIVVEATGASSEAALDALAKSDGNAKLAILIQKTGLDPNSARELLKANSGFLRQALLAFTETNPQ